MGGASDEQILNQESQAEPTEPDLVDGLELDGPDLCEDCGGEPAMTGSKLCVDCHKRIGGDMPDEPKAQTWEGFRDYMLSAGWDEEDAKRAWDALGEPFLIRPFEEPKG